MTTSWLYGRDGDLVVKLGKKEIKNLLCKVAVLSLDRYTILTFAILLLVK